jgi:hypothetical protein
MTYRTTIRPVSVTTLPDGVTYELTSLPWDFNGNRPDLKRSAHRYGTFTTDRPLTAAEMLHFGIVEA